MKRSVRSGIAIAGMAGGFWLLGQAVANADTADPAASGGGGSGTTAVAGADTSSDTTGGAGTSGGDAKSTNEQDLTAKNEVDNTATTGTIDASGGVSWVTVVAGNGNTVKAGSGEGSVSATQNVDTKVAVDSQANGGNVSGSNNASAGNGASYSAEANGSINSETTGGNGGDKKSSDGGDAKSNNEQDLTAKNDVDNTARSGDIYANGGGSGVFVLAGNDNKVKGVSEGEEWSENKDCESSDYTPSSVEECDDWCWEHDGSEGDHGNVDAKQNVDTEISVSSEANGGNVSGSNNASAGNGAGYSAEANGSIDSETTGGNGGDKGEGGDAKSNNDQDFDAKNDVDNDASTGTVDTSGGESVVEVIAGNGNKMYCWSNEGDVTCTQNITTIINIISMANGGDVSCSNNASAGNADNWECTVKSGEKPAEQKPAEKPAVQPVKAAPAAAKPMALSSSQPSGQLAFTGADVTLPLILGLVALVLGGGLTLAGRRRETATV